MHSDSTDVNELANFARQVGAKSSMTARPSATGSWHWQRRPGKYLDITATSQMLVLRRAAEGNVHLRRMRIRDG
jgi:hypothetical protein